jgi:hypothetical protein
MMQVVRATNVRRGGKLKWLDYLDVIISKNYSKKMILYYKNEQHSGSRYHGFWNLKICCIQTLDIFWEPKYFLKS